MQVSLCYAVLDFEIAHVWLYFNSCPAAFWIYPLYTQGSNRYTSWGLYKPYPWAESALFTYERWSSPHVEHRQPLSTFHRSTVTKEKKLSATTSALFGGHDLLGQWWNLPFSLVLHALIGKKLTAVPAGEEKSRAPCLICLTFFWGFSGSMLRFYITFSPLVMWSMCRSMTPVYRWVRQLGFKTAQQIARIQVLTSSIDRTLVRSAVLAWKWKWSSVSWW
jgi:hypothetical protein